MLSAEYVAGFVDGEGSFIVRPSNNTPGAMITVSNTDARVLVLMQHTLDAWGVKSSVYVRAQQIDNRKQVRVLNVHSCDSVHKLCTILRPYLIIKRPHAELLIEFINIRWQCHKTSWKSHSPREDEIYEEVKALNKRGPK